MSERSLEQGGSDGLCGDGSHEGAAVATSKRNLGPLLRRRLEHAAGDKGDLLQRFASADGAVPLSALLLDKAFRRATMMPNEDAVSASARMAALLQEAANEDGVDVMTEPRTAVRLSSASVSGSRKQLGYHAEAGAASISKASSSAAAPSASQRNVKNELQALLCKRLGRPVGKSDMVFSTRQVSDQPPSFEATLVISGRTFVGTISPQKKAAEQSAAQVALDAHMISERSRRSNVSTPAGDGNDSDSSEGERDAPCSLSVSLFKTPSVDYKGQLLAWLQARGFSVAPHAVKFTVTRCDPDEKIFKAQVVLVDIGRKEFEGSPQARAHHGSSSHARQAAQQSAAEKAMEYLATNDQAAVSPECCAACVRVLRIPADCCLLPTVETLEVHNDDFLDAAARALSCRDVLPHPLQWSGNRPKGICLYEAAQLSLATSSKSGSLSEKHVISELSDSDSLPLNARGTKLVGLAVRGDVLLLDASAHSRGAILADVTGCRYVAMQMERSGALCRPAAALNASRSMPSAGDPELPLTYDTSQWVGLDPRTLLQQLLQRRDPTAAAPKFEPLTCGSDGLHRAKVSWCAKAVQCVTGNIEFDGHAIASSSVTGGVRRTKAEAQQDAALAALHQLVESEEESATFASSGFAQLLQLLCINAESGRVVSAADIVPGTLLSLEYGLSLKRPGDAKIFEVEARDRFRCAVGAGVLHPAFERLAMLAPIGERNVHYVDCDYEGYPARACLEILVHERVPYVALQEDADATHAHQQSCLYFDPPLWRQRTDFVVKTLLAQGAKSAVDLGCGDGRLLEALLGSASLEHVVGVDHSEPRARAAGRRLERACSTMQTSSVYVTDLLLPDERWSGLDAVILSEVIEHLPDKQLPQVAAAIFGPLPRVVIVTTPNAEFSNSGNDGGRPSKQFRHSDHEREWTRAEFKNWALTAAQAYGYALVEMSGVGELSQHKSRGPCSQICVFLKEDDVHTSKPSVAREHSEDFASKEVVEFGCATHVDISTISSSALREDQLAAEFDLCKFVMREGCGEPPPPSSRVTVHHGTYLSTGSRISTSREGRRVEPCVFQLGGGKVLEAWQRAVATMRQGETAWIKSPPAFAFGEFGCPPHIPAGATLWFALELIRFKLPGTIRTYNDADAALEEGERHLDIGRADLKRGAFVQARQALRRALQAVPEKLLLGRHIETLQRYVALERASLLNQSLCSLRLAGAAENPQKAAAHWEEAVRVCTQLLDRSATALEQACTSPTAPENLASLRHALCATAAAYRRTSETWIAKVYFRRATARSQLNDITDAVSDLEAAQLIAPADTEIFGLLQALRRRREQVELRPEKMFVSILERERSDREREEAARSLEEKKRRREERLLKRNAAR